MKEPVEKVEETSSLLTSVIIAGVVGFVVFLATFGGYGTFMTALVHGGITFAIALAFIFLTEKTSGTIAIVVLVVLGVGYMTFFAPQGEQTNLDDLVPAVTAPVVPGIAVTPVTPEPETVLIEPEAVVPHVASPPAIDDGRPVVAPPEQPVVVTPVEPTVDTEQVVPPVTDAVPQ